MVLPEPFSPDLDHYKCYKVRSPKWARRGISIGIDDQFLSGGFFHPLKVIKPTRLCTPVDKNGEGIKNIYDHLICYKVKRAKGESKHERVRAIHVNNQFGPRQLDVKKPKELCLPSQKTFHRWE